MFFFIDDDKLFEKLKGENRENILLVERSSASMVLVESQHFKGKMDEGFIKKLAIDLIKYYDAIIFNWHITIPSFNIGKYPDKGKIPKTIVRYSGKIVGINPFIQNLVGDIVKAIAGNLKHRNRGNDIISIDFIENSFDNKG